MNRRLRTLTVSVLAVVLSFGAGMTVRHRLQEPPSVITHRAIPRQRVADGAPRISAIPLSAESAESLQALEKEWLDSWQGENPFRLQAALMLRILRGSQSNADFATAAAILFKAPEDSMIHEPFMTPFVHILIDRWAAFDPAAALQSALHSPGTQSQYNLTQRIMGGWTSRDPREALTFVLAQPQPWRNTAATALFDQLTRRDPALAMTLAAQAGEQGFKPDLTARVLRPWAMADSTAALQWIGEHAPPEKRFALVEACVESACTQLGLETMSEKIRGVGLTQRERDSLIWHAVSIAAAWSSPEKLESGLRCIVSIQDAEIRRKTVSWFAMGNISGEQFDALLNSLPAGPDRDAFLYGRARFGIVGFHFDPAQALERVAGLTSPNSQDELWRELGGRWGERDPVAVSQWLTGEPPGPRRDAVAGEFVRRLARTDPEAALMWSASIGDSGKRSRRLAELLPQWSAKDDAAARAWVESSSVLNEGDRAALQGVLANPEK